MARIDRVRENYEDVTERLFNDKTAFEDYLKFAGKFFKLPSAQSMTIYGTNPKATMVADFDTWKKFNRYVKRGTNSIAVLDNGGLKHYFDISQTNGSKTPYQWTLGKDTANALIDEVYEQSGIRFKSFSGCVNYLGAEQARENAENVMNTLNVSSENREDFKNSYISMTQYLIAARCELGSSFKYGGTLDLSALDMLHSKAEKERLCEFVQLAGKSVLLSLEKSINNIVMQERTVDYGRSKADMVRGGQEVLPRNQGGERQNVQARHDNIRVSGADGTRSDGGRTGTDERTDRSMGREVAEVNGGNAPRTDTVTSRAAVVGTDTPTDRPRGLGAAADAQDAVREEIPAPDGVQRVESVGEHVRSDSGQRDNGNGRAGSHRVNESATYSTENTEQTAEVISPAVSFSAIAKDILALDTAVKDSGSDIFVEDYLEKHSTNTHDYIVDMLTLNNHEPLRNYLDAVYREAYANREMIAEGIAAQNILADIQKATKPPEIKPTAVDTFKAKTAEMFSPVDGQTATDIENTVRDYVQGVLEDNGIDAEIVDLAVTGSRSRGLESGGSDIDVVVEYSSEFKEDAMFNILHEEPFDIGGIKVDINPIRKEETGTLGEYLENAEKTIAENHERKTERTVTAYRVGDFYELFDGDAHTSAELLNLTETTRNGKPMTGFPAHALDDYRQNFAKQGYALKIGDEREIENILKPAKDVKIPATKPSRIKDEDTILDWSKYAAAGVHSTFERIIREKNTEIDTNVKISLLPKAEDLSDYTLEIGIEPRAEDNQLYFAIKYDFRNEKTEKLTEVGVLFVDTDGVMFAAHWDHLPDYEKLRTWVEKDVAKAVNKIRENARERSPEEIRQTIDTPTEPVIEDNSEEEFEELPDESMNDYTYGEQINLFGEPMHEVEAPEKTIIGGIDIEEALKRELIHSGTGYTDGKFDVEQFYLEHKGDTKGFAKFLSDAYGIGGHSGEGKIKGVDHNLFDVRGIVMRIALDNGEETRVSWNWNKVANRISTLIDNHEYISQHEIDERIKRYQREYSLGAESPYYEKAKSILDHYGLLPEQTKSALVTDAQELEKGDKIRYEGKEWTVGTVSNYFIALNSSSGEYKNIYNVLETKWYDELNKRGFEFISSSEEIITDLDRAKELINDFCEREYESKGDFSDLTRVGIGYTEDEETGLPIQIYADLENFRIITQFNNVTVKVDEYTSLAKMNEVALSELNFDELILDAITYKANSIDVPDRKTETTVEEKTVETENAPQEQSNEIKAGDSFMYRGRVVTVTDDKGIYPDDIVISREEKAGGLSYAVTENVNAAQFAREAKRITPEMNEPKLTEMKAVEQARTETSAKISNPLVDELSKTFPADTAERLYNAFESAKMADWQDNQAKINRVKRALYDILGNEEQAESAFAILSTGEAPKLKDIVIDLSPRAEYYEREEVREQSRDKDISADVNEIAKTANTKIDFTITDENLGVGGAKEKFAANIAAIETLKRIESRNLNLAADMFKAQNATPDEQKILAGYVGWGGLSQAFDPNNKAWSKEYRQLKELLTDEEYATAKGSTLNAHYTTPTVISAIYKGLQNLGFEGGNILEPAMGVGNFFGAMPEEIRKNSHLSGVELDSITGRIAQQLYQNADVQIKGFEKTDFSDNYFDAAVGNVPFGSYSVSDKRYNRENFFIHDYFLAKTLDKLAPNGVAAIITTKGTLDKENPKVREYLARRADLIGAIRLPNTAFKANAGTEVTTDILFLQKREKMAVELPDWCYIAKDNNGVPVNQYFIDHPEMVLGTMKQGLEFSMYGNPNETACVPIEGADLKEQLAAAVANLKTNNAVRKHSEQRKAEAGVIAATADVRNFTFAEVDGKMYFRENNIMTEVADKNGNALTGKSLERIRALNELRRTFRTILTAQENNCSDAQLETYQKILNAQYDTFVKKFGYINDRANYQAFSKDDDYNSLCALEIINEETHEVTKSDFFSKRTVKQVTEITRVDTPQEALFVSVDTLGKLDIPYMAKLCEKEPDEVIEELKADNLIYLNPKKANPEKPYEGWEEASEYLSGNVRVKLRAAERAAEENPELQRNVDALTAVIPQKLEAGDITARIGVHWVDVEDYQKFLQEYAKAHFAFGEPLRRAYNGEYKIPFKGRDYSKAATEIFGTKRMNSLEIFENLLNNRDVVVKDKKIDPDGKEHYEINKKETELAQDKASKMKEAFKRWLWEEPERREKYVTRYNELFNCIVGRKYDGSHQTFPGMSPSITLKPHQLDAVARAKFGGNTLLAHCVGAGKSFEMVAATMEKKRLGLINKACVVVPKALVGQMASEWLRLYPQAKILTATEKDFDKDHRQKFIGRCCTGDYDAVVMSYEQFEKIPMSFEYRRDFIEREIKTLTSGIEDLKFNGGRNENSGSIKDMERVKKRLEARLEKLIEDNGKTKDTSLNFEQLGFDSLVVDEAHNYKNGLVVTKMQRVAGVQTTPAQKSEDILMKTQYLNENYGERNLLFATGTPVAGHQQLNAELNFNSVFVGNSHNLNHRCGNLVLFFKR